MGYNEENVSFILEVHFLNVLSTGIISLHISERITGFWDGHTHRHLSERRL